MSEINTTRICRECFWAAELTRTSPRVWCSHKEFHGWQEKLPNCLGKGFLKDDDRPRSREP